MASTSIKDHYTVSKTPKVSTKSSGSSSQSADQDKDDDLQILKQFDINWQYGPCIGVSRMERWERAAKYGLSPPQEVMDLINAHPNDDRYKECLWNDYTTLR